VVCIIKVAKETARKITGIRLLEVKRLESDRTNSTNIKPKESAEQKDIVKAWNRFNTERSVSGRLLNHYGDN